jgi:hypothetical protein
MSDGRSVFLKWRGDHPWSDWVKPTLFAQNAPALEMIGNVPIEVESLMKDLKVANILGDGACAIVDLPSDEGVIVGEALVDFNFYPVPIYNGVQAPIDVPAVIDNFRLQWRLFFMANNLRWPSSGGPAFLLDARRMTGNSEVSVFDNRWITMPQDYPSGVKMKQMGICRCYLITQAVGKDLVQVLYRWQSEGMEFLLWNGQVFEPTKITVPGFFERNFHRVKALIGLAPSGIYGFGAIVGGSTGG